jgi:hypothetical protein
VGFERKQHYLPHIAANFHAHARGSSRRHPERARCVGLGKFCD